MFDCQCDDSLSIVRRSLLAASILVYVSKKLSHIKIQINNRLLKRLTLYSRKECEPVVTMIGNLYLKEG